MARIKDAASACVFMLAEDSAVRPPARLQQNRRRAVCSLLLAMLCLGACTPLTSLHPARSRASTQSNADRPQPDALRVLELGKSSEGRPLYVSIYGQGPRCVLILGAIHGDEPGSHLLVRDVETWLEHDREVLEGLRVVVASPVNPDGLLRGTRKNARAVDLNRNFPARNFRPGRGHGSQPGSEPESRFVLALIERFDPELVISVHQPRHSVNWDGPARKLATGMAALCGYRLEASVGYATPGSLGSYFGLDLGRPIITLELGRRSRGKSFFEETQTALIYALRQVSSGA